MKSLIHFLRHHTIRTFPGKTDTGLYISIENETETRIYHDLFTDGDYDPAIHRLLQSTEIKPLNILDLGCNTGFFILRLLHIAISSGYNEGMQIIGVDASKKLCTKTKQRLERSNFTNNGIQIEIINGLIGERKGSGTFYHFKDHGLSSVFRTNGKADEIDFIDIEKIISHWNRIDLLKCDIEGSELAFISQYPDVLRKVKLAVIEFHPEFCDLNRCTTLLHEAGFTKSMVIREMPYSSIRIFSR